MSAPAEAAPERWRSVPGYEGLYSVSDLGRVRRDAAGVGTHAGRILKLSHHNNGYRHVILFAKGVKRLWFVHRLVTAAFIGPCPAGYEVDHINANRADNRVTNLRYLTKAQNVSKPGERNGRAKLRDADVRAIRAACAAGGVSQCALARRFGVDPRQIQRIAQREQWRHLKMRARAARPRTITARRATI